MMLQKRGLMGGGKRTTWNGQTVLEVEIPDGGFDFVINTVSPNSVSIDWGDGTVDTLRHHNYTAGGNYIIQIGRDATKFKLAWGSSASQQYLRNIYNFGENVSTWDNQSFAWNSTLYNVRRISALDPANPTNFYSVANGMRGNIIYEFPNGFCRSTSGKINFLFNYGYTIVDNLVLPPFFGENASDLSSFCKYGSPTIMNLPEGFGRRATTVNNFINGHTQLPILTELSFPEYFGGCVSENTNLFNFANSSYPAKNLINLTMNGNGTGFRHSINLVPATAISVQSGISVLTSLQEPEYGTGRQEVVFNTNRQSVFEASGAFIDAQSLANSRGWDVSYSTSLF